MLFKLMISTLSNNDTKILIFLLTLLNKSSTIIYVVRSSNKTINNKIIYFLEEYPSLVEGVGLENRKGCQSPRGFESLFLLPKEKPQGIQTIKFFSTLNDKNLPALPFAVGFREQQ